MQILKTSERVRVKIQDVTLVMSPMTYSKKLKMTSMTKVVDGKEMVDLDQMLSFVVKNCVKEISGVTGADGSEIDLIFDSDGTLSEESHSDVMSVVTGLKLHYDSILAVAGNKIPSKSVTNYATGEVVDGVEVEILPKQPAN